MAEFLLSNHNALKTKLAIAASALAVAGAVEPQMASADTQPPPQASVEHHPALVYHVPRPIKLPPLLITIGRCESTGSRYKSINYHAQNPDSTASGGWQELDSTWNHFHGYAKARYAPKRIQKIHAKWLFHTQGVSPWLSSKSCWG
jgi:hypothetical protein